MGARRGGGECIPARWLDESGGLGMRMDCPAWEAARWLSLTEKNKKQMCFWVNLRTSCIPHVQMKPPKKISLSANIYYMINTSMESNLNSKNTVKTCSFYITCCGCWCDFQIILYFHNRWMKALRTWWVSFPQMAWEEFIKQWSDYCKQNSWSNKNSFF